MTETNEELFFKPGVSPTSINQFFESPSRFWRYSSLNPNREKKEATPAMLFGRLVHCLILTPENFEKEFAMAPTKGSDDIDTVDEMKNFINANIGAGQKIPSKAKKDDLVLIIRQIAPQLVLWQDKLDTFYKTIGRKGVITQDQLDTATNMRDAMFENRAVRQLIGNGASETPFCWFPNGQDGLMKKAKLDYNRDNIVIEYKTTVGPNAEDFSRTIATMGYHRQIAMQIEGSIAMGNSPRGGIIIAQDKDQFDDIAVYALSASDIAVGHYENDYAFTNIQERLIKHNAGDKKAWRSFPEEIQSISLPRWYQRKA